MIIPKPVNQTFFVCLFHLPFSMSYNVLLKADKIHWVKRFKVNLMYLMFGVGVGVGNYSSVLDFVSGCLFKYSLCRTVLLAVIHVRTGGVFCNTEIRSLFSNQPLLWGCDFHKCFSVFWVCLFVFPCFYFLHRWHGKAKQGGIFLFQSW